MQVGALAPFAFRGVSSRGRSHLKLLPIKTLTFESHGLAYEAGIQPPTPRLPTRAEKGPRRTVRGECGTSTKPVTINHPSTVMHTEMSGTMPFNLVPAKMLRPTNTPMGEGCWAGLACCFCGKPGADEGSSSLLGFNLCA